MMMSKKKKKKAFWEDHVGGLTNKKTPKKVEKVKPKKPKSKKFVTKAKKEVEVQKKTDRSVEEVKLAKEKGMLTDLMGTKWFGEWLQAYCYKYVEKQATSRGQVPTELPEFNVLQRSQSSVELKRDAKGKIVFTIKAYADTSFKAAKEALNTFLQVVESVGNDEEE